MQSQSPSAVDKIPCAGLVGAHALSVYIIMKALITGPCLSLTWPVGEDPGSLPGPGGESASL